MVSPVHVPPTTRGAGAAATFAAANPTAADLQQRTAAAATPAIATDGPGSPGCYLTSSGAGMSLPPNLVQKPDPAWLSLPDGSTPPFGVEVLSNFATAFGKGQFDLALRILDNAQRLNVNLEDLALGLLATALALAAKEGDFKELDALSKKISIPPRALDRWCPDWLTHEGLRDKLTSLLIPSGHRLTDPYVLEKAFTFLLLSVTSNNVVPAPNSLIPGITYRAIQNFLNSAFGRAFAEKNSEKILPIIDLGPNPSEADVLAAVKTVLSNFRLDSILAPAPATFTTRPATLSTKSPSMEYLEFCLREPYPKQAILHELLGCLYELSVSQILACFTISKEGTPSDETIRSVVATRNWPDAFKERIIAALSVPGRASISRALLSTCFTHLSVVKKDWDAYQALFYSDSANQVPVSDLFHTMIYDLRHSSFEPSGEVTLFNAPALQRLQPEDVVNILDCLIAQRTPLAVKLTKSLLLSGLGDKLSDAKVRAALQTITEVQPQTDETAQLKALLEEKLKSRQPQ